MGTWSSGGNLNTARYGISGCGAANTALSFGGYDTTYSVICEEYSGTVWSSAGSLSITRAYPGGAGIQTAGLAIGGEGTGAVSLDSSEEYNGTTWSAGGTLLVDRHYLAAAGVQSAAVCFGGNSSGSVNTSEEYNGTTWSSGGNLSASKEVLAGCGTQTAGLCFGGTTGAYTNVTEEYDGAAWSLGGNMAVARGWLAGAGTQAAGLCFGGFTGAVSAVTEAYDGSAWSTQGALSIARDSLGGCGTTSSGLSFGGETASPLATTEEYETVVPVLVQSRHRGNTSSGSVLFNGKQYVGDYANGKIYQLDMNTYTDDGNAITRIRRTQIINKERVNVIHNKIEVDFEHGVGLDVASDVDGYDPQATLKWSDDGGNTWSAGVSVSMGKYGEYETRAIWRRLGKSRNRIYELTIEEPVKVVITGSYADLKACRF